MKIETPELKFNAPNENIKGDELKATRSKKRELGDAKKTQVKGRTTKQTKQRVKLTEEQKKARQREYNRRYYERHKEEIKAKARERYKLNKIIKTIRVEQIAVKAERLAIAQVEQEQLTGKRNTQLDKLIESYDLQSLFSSLYYRETLIATGRKPDVSAKDIVEQWLKANKFTTSDKQFDLLAALSTIDTYKDDTDFKMELKRHAEGRAKIKYTDLYNTLMSFGYADFAVYRTLQDILYSSRIGELLPSDAINKIIADVSKSDKSVSEIISKFTENIAKLRSNENILAGKQLPTNKFEAILRSGF